MVTEPGKEPADLHLRRMAALAGLELVSGPAELEDLLERIVLIAEDHLPASGGASIILWDPHIQDFTISVTTVPKQSAEYARERVRAHGATRWIVETRQPLVVSDIHEDPFGANPLLQESGLQAYAGVPLLGKTEVLGVLYVMDRRPRVYSESDLAFLRTLALRASGAIVNVRLFAELKRMALKDGLTGLLNRRAFYELASEEFRRARRYQRPIAVILMDVDHFKSINDIHGHEAGDRVLKQVSERLQAGLRNQDLLARIGGEEFAILLIESQDEAATQVAERLRRSIEGLQVTGEGGVADVTASFGVGEIHPSMKDLADLLRQADQALYRAKEAGRNLVRGTAKE